MIYKEVEDGDDGTALIAFDHGAHGRGTHAGHLQGRLLTLLPAGSTTGSSCKAGDQSWVRDVSWQWGRAAVERNMKARLLRRRFAKPTAAWRPERRKSRTRLPLAVSSRIWMGALLGETSGPDGSGLETSLDNQSRRVCFSAEVQCHPQSWDLYRARGGIGKGGVLSSGRVCERARPRKHPFVGRRARSPRKEVVGD